MKNPHYRHEALAQGARTVRLRIMQAFGQNLWLEGGAPVIGAGGFRFPTRMAVISLPDGVLVWSPVAWTEALGAEVAVIGPVGHILTPNHLHNLFLREWVAHYPQARIHAPPGLARKLPDLDSSRPLADGPDPEWGGDIDLAILPNRIADEVVLFHRPSGTALFCDLLQGMPPGWFTGWRAVIAKADLMTGDVPRVPRKFRLAMRRKAARPVLERILDWPVERVVMAHGTPVEEGGRDFLRRAFDWML